MESDGNTAAVAILVCGSMNTDDSDAGNEQGTQIQMCECS